MKTKQTIETHSEAETEDFARQLAAEIRPGTVLALHGDLGAGKTVFTRGFARGLGVTEAVSSPTYTILQEYRLPADHRLYHLDLYRINNYVAALGFGVEEYLEDPEAYIIAEWPERIKELLPETTLHIRLEHVDENTRRITVGVKPDGF